MGVRVRRESGFRRCIPSALDEQSGMRVPVPSAMDARPMIRFSLGIETTEAEVKVQSAVVAVVWAVHRLQR